MYIFCVDIYCVVHPEIFFPDTVRHYFHLNSTISENTSYRLI